MLSHLNTWVHACGALLPSSNPAANKASMLSTWAACKRTGPSIPCDRYFLSLMKSLHDAAANLDNIISQRD